MARTERTRASQTDVPPPSPINKEAVHKKLGNFLTSETYLDRVMEGRKKIYPKITAEEDAEIAQRTGRAQRVFRCGNCNRNFYLEHGCFHCTTFYAHETRR